MGTGQPDRSILLVGMMGSGKSAVGRALADAGAAVHAEIEGRGLTLSMDNGLTSRHKGVSWHKKSKKWDTVSPPDKLNTALLRMLPLIVPDLF